MKQFIKRKQLPYPLHHAMDNLITDTGNGTDGSAYSHLVQAYNADKLGRSFFPALLTEAKNALSILDGNDDTEDFPDLVSEQKQLRAFIKKLAAK